MSERKPVSYQPTEGLSYDPLEPKYWEPALLRKETERIFEVCNGCRMCFKYCDSFPSLFSLLDNRYDGDVRRLTDADVDGVVDSCFQCKLCEVQCPYTPRDGHEFQVDFPKLVHRHRAQRVRQRGRTLRERVLGNPLGLARLARASLGLANIANRTRLHRWFLEKVLGIHRDKLLPDFASRTFERWATAEGRARTSPSGEAVLFPTCYVDANQPAIGRDTIFVLEKSGVAIDCTTQLACCGMPAWEHGDLATLQRNARHNLDRLGPWVDAGKKVVVINPTCSMMMRREYKDLVAEPDRDRAHKLAAAVTDPSELLWAKKEEGSFNTDFQSTPGDRVAYHAPCHLRAQAVGFRGRDLIRKVPGVKPQTVMECCGHDGTYAMTVEGFGPSARLGKKAFDEMAAAGTPVWATDCPLAALQFKQHAGVSAMHPMTLLARAYEKDGFEDPKQLEARDEEGRA